MKRLLMTMVVISGMFMAGSMMAETIYEVQHNDTDQGSGDDCYPSPLIGDTVTLSGIVSAVQSVTYPDFWLEAPANGLWSGVYVYDITVNPSRGDSVTITGEVYEYYGMTELHHITSFTNHSSHNLFPDPIEISTGTLAGGCSSLAEAYEGLLVKIRDVVVTAAVNQYGEWYVEDGSGACQIDDKIFHYEPEFGETLSSIIGVVTYSFGEYEINPRDTNDVIPQVADSATAYRINSPDPLLWGPYAHGQLYDYMMENDRIAVVISDRGHIPFNAMSGGNIIDAGSSGDRFDALGEFHTYFDDDWPRQALYDSLEIVENGAGGGPAVIRVYGVDSFDSSLAVVTEYSLAADTDYLTVTTTVTDTGTGTSTDFELGDVLHWGACQSFAPGYGFWLVGTTSEPWLAGIAGPISYGYLSPLGDVWGPNGGSWSDVNVTIASLGPSDSCVYGRYFIVGGRDIASVAAVVHEINGTPVGFLDCTVSSQSSGDPLAGAKIDVYNALDSIYLQMETDTAGLAAATVPPSYWHLVASAGDHLPDEAWLPVQEGDTARSDFILACDGEIPAIGDTLTIIQRPLVNIPALVTPGDTLVIECEANPLTGNWLAEVARGVLRIPLQVLTSTYDPTTLWWQISAQIPEVPVYELYDLWVTADGGIEDVAQNAVRVIPEFKNDYYFIHITDTHLPTHQYHYESGADQDSSEVMDLRMVIADINIINPEFVLLTGDVVNEGELENYLYWRVFTRSQRLLYEFQVPVFVTAGNHDIGGWPSTPPPDGTARRDWWRFFGWKRLGNPPPGAPWYTQNYSFDYGPVHYVGLEAYDNYDLWRSEIYGETSFISSQLQWLANDLAAASGSAAQVLFYHYDFKHELDLSDVGVEMALWGHIHRDEGSISTQPYDLATNNTCDGERSYRLIRVSNGVLQPTPTISAGSNGENLHVQFLPANDGTHDTVTAHITNNLNERFEHAQLRFLMPSEADSVVVSGGSLLQIDDSDSVAVCHVGVDILPTSSPTVVVTFTSIGIDVERKDRLPQTFRLEQNYPNPFNPITEIEYAVPRESHVRLEIYNILGQRVTVLVDELQKAGYKSVHWDSRSVGGGEVTSGIYFCRLQAGDFVRTRKMVLLH